MTSRVLTVSAAVAIRNIAVIINSASAVLAIMARFPCCACSFRRNPQSGR